MSLLDSLRRGWWAGWSEPFELISGGAGLLESLIPGDVPDDPLERLEAWGEEEAKRVRLKGGGGEPEGLLEKIMEGIGAAPGTVFSYAPFMLAAPASWGAAAGGAIARPALAFGLHGLVRHGDEGLPTAIGQGLRGAAEGAVFGHIGKLAGALRPGINTARVQALRKAAHAGGTGTFIGGMTGLHGGTLEESVAAGTTMSLLGALASGKYKPKAKSFEQKLAEERPAVEKYFEEKPLLEPRYSEMSIEELRPLAKGGRLGPYQERDHTLVEGFIEGKGKLNKADPEYDAKIGRLLGYTEKDIAKFYLDNLENYGEMPTKTRLRLRDELDPEFGEILEEGYGGGAPMKIPAPERVANFEAAGYKAKAPDSPLRTAADLTQFESLHPGAKVEILRRYKDKGKYIPRGEEDLNYRAATKIYTDENGKLIASADNVDALAYHLEKTKVDIGNKINELSFLQRRAAKAGNELEVNSIQEQISAYNLDLLSNHFPSGGTKSVLGAGLRGIGLARRGSPEWLQIAQAVQKKMGKLSQEFMDLLRMSDGNPELLRRLARVMDTPKLFDFFQEYWINGLLSGLPTQMVNTSSNMLRGAVDFAEKGIALKMQKAGRDPLAAFARDPKAEAARELSIGEMQADFQAGVKALPVAVKVFSRMFLNENFDLTKNHPQFAEHLKRSKLDYNTKTIPGKIGQLIRIPGTALQAMDIAFKIVAGDRYAHAEAYRMSMKDVKEGKIGAAEQQTQMQKYLGHGDAEVAPQVLKAMRENAQRLTFTEPLPAWGQSLLKLRDTKMNVLGTELRPGVMVLPFVSTPFNVIKQAVHRSPLGILRFKSLKNSYDKGDITPQEYYREIAATSMGTMLTVGMVGLARAGFITGGGPVNQQDRQNLIATGWRPYSIHIGNTYTQLQRLEPFGTILGMAGDIAEFGDSEDKIGKMIAAVKDNVTDKSFLYGLESFAKAFANPEQRGETYYRQMTGSLVPTFFAKGAQAIDPYMRRTEGTGAQLGIPDALAYRIPGLSQELPIKTTALGKPKERWGVASAEAPIRSAIQTLTSAAPISGERSDTEVEQEFNRLRSYEGMPPSMPRRTKKLRLRGVDGTDVELTTDEYAIYDRYHAMAKDQLAKMIASPQYARIPDALKSQMLLKTYRKYRAAANKQVNSMIMRRTTVGN